MGYRFLYDHRMTTTLDIRDDLLSQAKAQAARERTTLTRLIEEGLTLRLRSAKPQRVTELPPLPISKCTGGMPPGLDPTSNKSLFDAADEQ
jgi:hypothetical protein